MFPRHLNPLKSNSFFLFGARGTGKSTLIKNLFEDFLYIDLLEEVTYRRYATDLTFLQNIVITKKYPLVIIDEIQRLPYLLNTVHLLIESTKTKFVLTCSSLRKLNRGQANLLAGRAFLNYLYPLTHLEQNEKFDLDATLHYGSLPKIFEFENSLEKDAFLNSYVSIYIKEEIRLEQIVRKIEPFLSFLEIMAASNGEIINASKIGRNSATSGKMVERYIEILTDTLLGFYLPACLKSVRNQTITTSKFFFFDLGIKRALENSLSVPIRENSYAYGKAFEHFFILECKRLDHYFNKNYKFTYLKTKDGVEIDLILQLGPKTIAIEIKSSTFVDTNDLSNTSKLANDLGSEFLYVASREKVSRLVGKIKIMPWFDLIQELFII